MSSGSESEQPQRRRNLDWQKTIEEQKQKSLLISEIYKILEKSSINLQNISSFKSNTILKLKIIQQKPVYVADSKTCMQALFKQMPKEQLNPFNNFTTDYYNPHSKPPIVFNCHDQTVEEDNEEELKFPSPYHPAYHYKNHYQNFKQRRKSTKVSVSCETVQIKCWSVAIVNISCSGYYAPVLIIHDFRKIYQKSMLDRPVQNILFSKELKPFLQSFRIEHMRKKLQTIQKQKNPISFTFFIRNQVTLKKNIKISQFATLDTKGSLLSTNQNLPVNFVPMGSINQYQIFKRPVPPKYLSKKRQINLQNFNMRAQRERQNRQQMNSSFESESSSLSMGHIQENRFQQQQNRNGNRIQDEYQIDEQSEEHSDDQDYLKKIYAKRLEQNKQTII